MKKAVIATGGKQYLVKEGQEIEVELLKDEKTTSFEPLLVIEGDKTIVGSPTVKTAKVTASVVEREVKSDKVTSIRYKAKKRVKTIKGHRQLKTKLKITKIA